MANSKTARLSIAIIGMVLIVLTASGYLLVRTVLDKSNLAHKREEFALKGTEFGNNSDQAGCIQEGLLRSKTIMSMDFNSNFLNEAFVYACLRSGRPTLNFCGHIPREDILQWGNDQCEKIRMDLSKTGCSSVFKAKADFCSPNRRE